MVAIKFDEMPVTAEVCNEIVDGGNKIDAIIQAQWYKASEPRVPAWHVSSLWLMMS